MKQIYLDYAATTPVKEEVLNAMLPYFSKNFGNANSLHSLGQKSYKAIEKSREEVAKFLNCSPEEIYFTSSSSEAVRVATWGTAIQNSKLKQRVSGLETDLFRPTILSLSTEHINSLDTSVQLIDNNIQVKQIKVNSFGEIDINSFKAQLNDSVILVNVMSANNEVGTIYPIAEIVQLCANHKIPVHTDATAAACYQKLDVKKSGVSMLSFGGHKIYGPKGVGVLYVKRGTPFKLPYKLPTPDTPAIVGVGKACRLAKLNRTAESQRLTKLRDYFIDRVLTNIKGSVLTGHPTNRLPNIASFLFKNVEGEAILLMLNEYGIMASTGSACSSHDLKASHVLLAMGFKEEDAHGSIRFSLGYDTTAAKLEYTVKVLKETIEKLRRIGFGP